MNPMNPMRPHRAAVVHRTTPAESPTIPPFEELDALAASGTPSAAAAWWMTSQVVEHVFSTISRIDPRTGVPLPRPLTEILRDLRETTRAGSRPFPHDGLLHAAEFARASLEHLLDHHRHRIVRVHRQLPFHQLREIDHRSIAWLARQPGRNIREKLTGRTHALGVQRDASADTTENRLLRSFAKLFVQRAKNRLACVEAYDATPADKARIRRIEEFVHLCDDRLRRSGLADVPPLTKIQPNNVLLGDPHYSRIFRAWGWLRDEEEALRAAWATAVHRARIVLYWMVASHLAHTEQVVITEKLGRVRVGRGSEREPGVEWLTPAAQEPESSWHLNPTLEFFVLPSGRDDAAFRLRLSLENESIKVHIATLCGNGLLGETAGLALTFDVQAITGALQPRRGLGLLITTSAATSARGVDRGHADVAGLREFSTKMTRLILQRCRLGWRARNPGQVAPRLADDARMGLDIGQASLHASSGQPVPLSVAPWTLALALPKDTGDFEWLDGRANREFVVGAPGQSLWTTGDLLDIDEQADAGMLALASDRIFRNLASELDMPGDARLAYTVPDAVDDFSQRHLRNAVPASFHRPIPVWRSVAAATAWAQSSTGERGPRAGESVIVVDTEFSGVSLTVLTARHDEKLARTRPASHGLYWERKPPLPPDESLEMLGWPQVLHAYARHLTEPVLGAQTPDRQERIIDDLLRSGRVSALIGQGGSIFVQVVADDEENRGNVKPTQAVEFFDDPAVFDELVARWAENIDRAVNDTTRADPTLRKARLLLIGGPCAYPRFSGHGIGEPEAGQMRLVHPLTQWLHERTRITPLELAEGARECLLRLESKTLAWREWRPALSLEVIRDGYFSMLPLPGQGDAVDPFFGASVEFLVPQTLTLGGRHPWFLLPLMVGQQDQRPVAREARLESPAFPLAGDVCVQLTLSYQNGLENSYEIHAEPISQEPHDQASFRYLEAKWDMEAESAPAQTPQAPPRFELMPWSAKNIRNFSDAADAWCGRPARIHDDPFFSRFRRDVQECWSSGRSLATAPPIVRQAFPAFRQTLLQALDQAGTVDVHHVPRALEILTLLHEDAPERTVDQLLALDDEAEGSSDLYKQIARMMANLVGDGAGPRALLLDRLLQRLKKYTNFGTYHPKNPTLARHTMAAINQAAWRHPAFITALALHPQAVEKVLGQCRRSLQNLSRRIPHHLEGQDLAQQAHDRDKISKLFSAPFRDSCGILLALLRIESENPTVAALRGGSASASSLARATRQIDGRFAALDIRVDWRGIPGTALEVDQPSELHRMSKIAFELNHRFNKGAGTNLCRITR